MWSFVVPCCWVVGEVMQLAVLWPLVGVCACLCENVYMFECVCAQSMCVVYACVSVCGNCECVVIVSVCECFILLGH